ncbi:phosphonoacetaldehyde hydrolase [Kurthia sp. Dielmo]|uniref:phosphonoacetaldehyde hydrolase n=1 Tax=Kurthia sp. Dielmo TaxID=1033738 RepID=UPI00111EB9B9|nr:phosphonoacetaldehyde hydrolase [Kurthia sp. Dielmo]
MTKIKGVILDWAGTAVDFGCFAPVNVFLQIFEQAKVPVTLAEAREPMGMLKIDHIRAMLAMPRIAAKWQEVYGRPANHADVKTLYTQFETQLFVSLAQYTTPIPHVLETVKLLRERGIKIGSTTGYTKEMMDIVVPNAKAKGYAPDHLVTPDDVGNQGRPYPYMIFENMRALGLDSVKTIIKVGDTASDIQEAKNAGVYAIGVLIGSSEMGLSEEEFNALTPSQQQHAIASTRQKFEAFGADTTIETLAELPAVIDLVEQLVIH